MGASAPATSAFPAHSDATTLRLGWRWPRGYELPDLRRQREHLGRHSVELDEVDRYQDLLPASLEPDLGRHELDAELPVVQRGLCVRRVTSVGRLDAARPS